MSLGGATEYHSPGEGARPAEGGEPGSPVSDIFGTPAASRPHCLEALEEEAWPESQGSPSFRGLVGARGAAAAAEVADTAAAGAGGGGAVDDDGASSVSSRGSGATVSEAAAVARTLHAASALKQDREALTHQVESLSQELRELKERGVLLPMDALAAATPAAAAGPGEGRQLLESRRLHAAEEKHLRSEVDTLNRKVWGCCLHSRPHKVIVCA